MNSYTGDQYTALFFFSQKNHVALDLAFRSGSVDKLTLGSTGPGKNKTAWEYPLSPQPSFSLVSLPHTFRELQSMASGNELLAPKGHSSSIISDGCRKLIIASVRAYPRMVTRLDNLPPFIHPLACRLHYRQGNAMPPDSSPVTLSPLKPMAACINIAHMFNARTTSSDPFLWRTIESEHSRIKDEVRCPRECGGQILLLVFFPVLLTAIIIRNALFR